MSIYNTAVNKPISTLMVFIAIMVLGVASYIQLPVDQYPKMDPPYLTVMATYPGANASDIEENVTKILEDQLNSVDNLKEMTSTSYDNLGVISLEFGKPIWTKHPTTYVTLSIKQCKICRTISTDRPLCVSTRL